jgi:hypothetical protein
VVVVLPLQSANISKLSYRNLQCSDLPAHRTMSAYLLDPRGLSGPRRFFRRLARLLQLRGLNTGR